MYYRVLGPFINLVHSVPPGKETQVSCQRRNPFFSSPLPHEDQMLSLVQRFLSTDFWDNKGPSLLRNKGFIVYYDQFLLFWSRKRDVVFWVHMDLFKLLGKLKFWKKKILVLQDLNPGPPDLKSNALPTTLSRQRKWRKNTSVYELHIELQKIIF